MRDRETRPRFCVPRWDRCGLFPGLRLAACALQTRSRGASQTAARGGTCRPPPKASFPLHVVRVAPRIATLLHYHLHCSTRHEPVLTPALSDPGLAIASSPATFAPSSNSCVAQMARPYLAYGSNLHVAQMAHRCPDSVFLGKQRCQVTGGRSTNTAWPTS